MILPDVLDKGLSLVFCGTAPSRASKDARAYYAHPGNIFWKTLYEVGLTPRQLKPQEYPQLLALGIGLTDLNKMEWGADASLTPASFDVTGFHAKMLRYRPKIIAFTSKHAASQLLGRRPLQYGLQDQKLGDIRLFVLPSTSGRARRYFDLSPWRELAHMVNEL